MTIVRLLVLVIQFLLAAAAIVLAIAFVLGILGANPEASFAAWIYERADSLMTPFSGIFDPINLTEGTSIRTSLLFAVVVYAVLAALLGAVAARLTKN